MQAPQVIDCAHPVVAERGVAPGVTLDDGVARIHDRHRATVHVQVVQVHAREAAQRVVIVEQQQHPGLVAEILPEHVAGDAVELFAKELVHRGQRRVVDVPALADVALHSMATSG